MRILLIEDDKRTADYVVAGLTEEGHVADRLSDGREGLIQAAAGAKVFMALNTYPRAEQWPRTARDSGHGHSH